MGSKSKNQTLYIAIGVGVLVLVLVFIFMWMKSPDNKKPEAPPPQPSSGGRLAQAPPPPKQAPNPDHETKLEVGAPPPNDPSKPTIAMFYASWCGPSRSALPEWQKLEAALKGSPVQTLSFEDSTAKNIIMENGIKGYPTIRLYPEGFPGMNFIEYQGPRTFESLFQFVKNGGKM